MTTNQRQQLPWRLLLLDLIGSVLIAIGLIQLFFPDSELFPQSSSFPYLEWVLIVAGLVIMLPAVRGLLAFMARTRRR